MYEPDERSRVDLRLFRVWMKAYKAVFDNVSRDIAGYGLSLDQFKILELLYSKGPHPIQKISDTLSIPSGSITYVVDKLEGKGWVTRRPSPTDRRGYLAALTEAGERMFNDIFPKHAEVIGRNLAAISEDEKRLLTELLKKIGLSAEALAKEDAP